jgi:hypothetical protein
MYTAQKYKIKKFRTVYSHLPNTGRRMLAVATLEVISVIKPKHEFKKHQSELRMLEDVHRSFDSPCCISQQYRKFWLKNFISKW